VNVRTEPRIQGLAQQHKTCPISKVRLSMDAALLREPTGTRRMQQHGVLQRQLRHA
jgi:hypothetical protein